MSSEDNSSEENISSRVMKGAAWMAFTRFGTRLLGMLSTIVLARLLVPEDFGIVAIASSYYAILEGMSQFNSRQALIKYRDAGDNDYNTAWTLNICRGILVCVAILASTFFVPDIVSEPRVAHVILLMAVIPLIDGFENPRFVVFEKNLDFTREMVITLGTKLLTLTVTIYLAFTLRSYWAMIIGLVFGSASRMTISYLMIPYLPRFCFASFDRIFSFSGWMSGVNILQSLSTNLDKFFVAHFLGTAATGIYHIGKTVAFMPTYELVMPLNRALYPGFAMIAGKRDYMREKVLESAQFLAGLSQPIGIGFALIAPEFIYLVYGPNWLDAIPIVQILAAASAFSMMGSIAIFVAMAHGDTKYLFFRELMMFLALPVFVITGVHYFGFIGAVYGIAARQILQLVLNMLIVQKLLDLPLLRLMFAPWRSMVSAAVMALCLLVLNSYLPHETIADKSLTLTAKIGCGVLTYAVTHILLWIMAGKPKGFEHRLSGIIEKKFLRRSQA
ncbi:lipopolysaccharide biosynthesis protein [Emcibacter nanhaiensis]|uniref:Lipopolysaccharide biosynthesis protein n=1 Tax=Emcibacter nanhaiensis TaxID=1505037 RepID=A0A501PBG6_9PROT|nr:lipopolysaccharide biosynthesis protein [Emcibacter nanhaiensis]TPD57342.1 lipopolysaccharide biosynthesis protein [Emcibacter nanhaiensis]